MAQYPKKEKDPVCGMNVDPAHSSHKAEHKHKKYSFCSGACMEKFKKNPDQFAK